MYILSLEDILYREDLIEIDTIVDHYFIDGKHRSYAYVDRTPTPDKLDHDYPRAAQNQTSHQFTTLIHSLPGLSTIEKTSRLNLC